MNYFNRPEKEMEITPLDIDYKGKTKLVNQLIALYVEAVGVEHQERVLKIIEKVVIDEPVNIINLQNHK